MLVRVGYASNGSFNLHLKASGTEFDLLKAGNWRNNGPMVCFRQTTKRRFQSKAWKFGEFWSLIDGLPISSLRRVHLVDWPSNLGARLRVHFL